MTPLRPSRRTLLGSGLLMGLGGLSSALTACSASSNSSPPAPSPTGNGSPTSVASGPSATGGGGAARRVLLAYYSRAGENYYYGGRRDLAVGNTEVLTRMIAELIDCDVYRIEATDPYPEGYDATVARNVDEQDADARPAIADPLASIAGYEQVLLGSPIWNVRPPMIMSTFAESHDFAGTTVRPFVTYAVSGLGSTERVYTEACAGARISPGLAVRGEEVTQRRDDAETWLRQNGLLSG
jgi:flavodoxin